MGEYKALPIGIQTFEDLRNTEKAYLYVDKTEHLFNLVIKGSRYNFLSRPRRFRVPSRSRR